MVVEKEGDVKDPHDQLLKRIDYIHQVRLLRQALLYNTSHQQEYNSDRVPC